MSLLNSIRSRVLSWWSHFVNYWHGITKEITWTNFSIRMNRDLLDGNSDLNAVHVEIPANPDPNPDPIPVDKLMTFDKAFDLTGYGKFNFVVILCAGLLLLHSTMELVGMGFVMPAATCDLELNYTQHAFVNTATLMGLISSLILSGYLADLYGRKSVIMSGVFLASTASAISAVVPELGHIAYFRIITGGLISGSTASIFSYISEMNMKKHRASAIAWATMFIPMAMIFIPAAAYIFLPLSFSLQMFNLQLVPWRVVIWTWPVPGLLGAILLLWLPESPRFLYNRAPPQEALKALAFMYAFNHDKKEEDFPVKSLVLLRLPQSGSFKRFIKDIKLIYNPALRTFTLFSIINMILIFSASSGSFLWYPRILSDMLKKQYSSICSDETLIKQIEVRRTAKRKLYSFYLRQSTDPSKCHPLGHSDAFPMTMAMGAIFCIVYLVMGLVLTLTLKRKLLGGVVVISGAAMSLVGFLKDPWATTIILIIALCGGCAVAIQVAMITDVYPTCIRATVVSLMFMLGRISSIMGGSFVSYLLRPYCQVTFYGLGMALIVMSLLLFFWPNPKRAKERIKALGYAY